MDSNHLRRLRRAELQKLAKENGIKANLKSETIINELSRLKYLRNDSPLPSFRSPSSGKIDISPKIASKPGGTNYIPNDSEAIADTLVESDAAKQFFERSYLDPEDGAEILGKTTPTYTLSTPESSLAGTPEPEAPSDVLDDVARNVAFLSGQNKQTLEHIARSRFLAARLRSRATEMRAALRAHASRRERMEVFVTYWRDTGSRWSYQDIWDAEFRTYVGPSGTDYGEMDTDAEEKIIASEKKYARDDALRSGSEERPRDEASQGCSRYTASVGAVAQFYDEDGMSQRAHSVSASPTPSTSAQKVIGTECLQVETGAINVTLDATALRRRSSKKRRREEDVEPSIEQGNAVAEGEQARRRPRRRVQGVSPEPAMGSIGENPDLAEVEVEERRQVRGKRKKDT